MHTLIIPHRDLANWLVFCAAYGAELVGVDHEAVDKLVDRPLTSSQRAPAGALQAMQRLVEHMDLVESMESTDDTTQIEVANRGLESALDLFRHDAPDQVEAGNAARNGVMWRGTLWWAYRALLGTLKILHARAALDADAKSIYDRYRETTLHVLLMAGEITPPGDEADAAPLPSD